MKYFTCVSKQHSQLTVTNSAEIVRIPSGSSQSPFVMCNCVSQAGKRVEKKKMNSIKKYTWKQQAIFVLPLLLMSFVSNALQRFEHSQRANNCKVRRGFHLHPPFRNTQNDETYQEYEYSRMQIKLERKMK